MAVGAGEASLGEQGKGVYDGSSSSPTKGSKAPELWCSATWAEVD